MTAAQSLVPTYAQEALMRTTTPDFRNVLSADLPVIAADGPTLAPTSERWAEVEARVIRRTKENLR